MTHRIQIVFQTPQPRRLAEFWRTALGYVTEPPPDGHESWELFAAETGIDLGDNDIDSAIDPDGHGPRFLFERVDEPTFGNALHLDINVTRRNEPPATARGAIDRKAGELQTLGAVTQRIVDTADRYWVEMTDPDGNWFCIQ